MITLEAKIRGLQVFLCHQNLQCAVGGDRSVSEETRHSLVIKNSACHDKEPGFSPLGDGKSLRDKAEKLPLTSLL